MHLIRATAVLYFTHSILLAGGVTHLGRLGLYDQAGGNEFTRNGGFRSSEVEGMTQSGFVRGTSDRYLGGNNLLGKGAWLGNVEGATVRVGLYGQAGGNEFIANNLTRMSVTTGMNEAGHTIGHSTRYLGTNLALGQAAWVADAAGNTTRVGLFDAGGNGGYTSNSGVQISTAFKLTPSGHISGTSQRYTGGTLLGLAAWMADTGGTTTRIGNFSGSEFTQLNGFQNSEVTAMADTGFIMGRSNRFNGTILNRGFSAWIASPLGFSNRVGLQSADYTGTDGTQWSEGYQIINSGHATGISQRRAPGKSGTAAWVATSSGATQRVGLWTSSIPNEFTSNGGLEESEPSKMVESGYVIGTSSRFNGLGVSRGQAGWLANTSGQTLRVGYYDQFGGNEHRRFDGFQETDVEFLNESGRTAGYSLRFAGGNVDLGRSAWTSDATGFLTRLGFFDQQTFTRVGGYQRSDVLGLSEGGHLIGTSEIFSGGAANLGAAAWVALGSGAPTRIGLFATTEFRRSNGERISRPVGVTASGLVHGVSVRYNNGISPLGQATWLTDSAGLITNTIGLYDAMHTRSNDEIFNETEFLTDQGIAAGYTKRYNKLAAEIGQTAWIFDRTTGIQQRFDLSVRANNSESFSKIHGITADGLAYGTFRKYSGSALVGDFAFIWSRATGIVKFDGSAPAYFLQSGWNHLTSIDAKGGGLFASEGQPAHPAGGQGVALWTTAGFADWDALDSLPADQRGPGDTPAGDGVANLVKYALGVLPMDSARERLPKMGTAHSQNGQLYPVASFIRSLNAPGVEIVVQVANQLEYSTDLGHTVLSRVNQGDGTELVTVRSNASYSQQVRQFFRLKIKGL